MISVSLVVVIDRCVRRLFSLYVKFVCVCVSTSHGKFDPREVSFKNRYFYFLIPNPHTVHVLFYPLLF